MDKGRNPLHEHGDRPFPPTGLTPRSIARRLLSGECDPVVDLVGMPREFHPPSGWDTKTLTLPCDLIYCVGSGSMLAQVDGESMTVLAGGLIWISAGRRFRLWRQNPGRLLIHRFRLHLFGDNRSPKRRIRLAPAFIHVQGLGEGSDWCQRIAREAASPGEESGPMIRGLLACLMIHIVRHRDATTQAGLTQLQRQSVAEAMTRCEGWPDLNDLASAAGLSPDYFSRLFRRSYGMSAREWIVRERIRSASALLAESAGRIGDIASQLGYQDLFYFCRQFRQVTGMTPTAFRKKMAQLPP